VLVASITERVTDFIGNHGIYAVFGLMLVDAVLPAASELVMVDGGALAVGAIPGGQIVLFGHPIHSDFWGFVAVSLAGTLGYLIGSMIGWGIGAYGGRPLIEGRGRWVNLTPENFARAEAWVDRRGDSYASAADAGRTSSSIPAGVFRSPFGRCTLLTLAGSAIWCFVFAGMAQGCRNELPKRTRLVDSLSIAGVVFVAAWLVFRHFSEACPCDDPSLASRRSTSLIPELKDRFAEVLESGRFILGPNVAAFEEEAASYLVGDDRRRQRHRYRLVLRAVACGPATR
jgi:membrane protein DedA with SNARE-associated domain